MPTHAHSLNRYDEVWQMQSEAGVLVEATTGNFPLIDITISYDDPNDPSGDIGFPPTRSRASVLFGVCPVVMAVSGTTVKCAVVVSR